MTEIKKLIGEIEAKKWDEKERSRVAKCFLKTINKETTTDKPITFRDLILIAIDFSEFMPLHSSMKEILELEEMSAAKLAHIMIGTKKALFEANIIATNKEIINACLEKTSLRPPKIEKKPEEKKPQQSKKTSSRGVNNG